MTAVGTTGATAGLARHRGAIASTITMALAVAFGEAAFVALTGAARHVAGGANAGAWALATVVNAVLGYLLLGLPQIRAWESGVTTAEQADEAGFRTRLAARSLSGGGRAAFAAAGVIGGPPAVGWFYGRRRDPRARSLTWTAAWLCAASWSAIYLGLLAWIF